MKNQSHTFFLSFLLLSFILNHITNAQYPPLTTGFYKNTCPDLESIVQTVVQTEFQLNFATASTLLRLFFIDCFIRGCDASILLETPEGKAEKDNPVNSFLSREGLAAIVKAKEAVENYPHCKNKVSCADILALASRDAISLAGGPYYEVELGRKDGKISTNDSVEMNLPGPGFILDQLINMFSRHGLNLIDLVALSGAHSIGFSRCRAFSDRIYNFSSSSEIDPALNPQYAQQLKKICPPNANPSIGVDMISVSPRKFDNVYFKNLQNGKGLFTSDQVLFTDRRSQAMVNLFASNNVAFEQSFVKAMIKLGRVGVLTGNQGEIRTNCRKPN